MTVISIRVAAAAAFIFLVSASSGCEGENEAVRGSTASVKAPDRQQPDTRNSEPGAGSESHASDAASAATANATATNPSANQVSIDNFTFSPQTLTVVVGASVTWLNRDDVPHSVVSNDKLFKSELLDTDEKYSFKFTKPGEYSYFCGIHPHMTGKIVVK
jgi:plastocyanin